jgi:hypothetical protein
MSTDKPFLVRTATFVQKQVLSVKIRAMCVTNGKVFSTRKTCRDTC